MARKRRGQRQQPGGSNLLVDILTLPVLGAPRMVHWAARKLSEEVEHQEFDEGAIQGQILDLQMRYELGEINDEEYDQQETALLDRLSYIRRAKEEE
ncbi:MAG: gas vesicle protein GvpG [Dehalococcoidia bacterium]